jgi:hypothetical protein
MLQIVDALPVSVIAPVPNAMVRVPAPVEAKERLVRVNVCNVSVPDVSVNAPDNVSPAPNVRPTVLLLNATEVQIAPAAVVQVPVPELVSKVTVSAATGADAPEAPPEVAAQFAVELAFHVPVPPTQNLAAIA